MTIKTHNIRIFGFRSLLLVGIILLSMACTNERTIIETPIATAINSLVGEWDWIKTVYAYPPQESTPETEEYTSSIKFIANDTVEYYKNGIITYKYPYEVKYIINAPHFSNSDSTLVLVINNGTKSYFSTDNDTLIIDQEYVDGPTSYYERMK